MRSEKKENRIREEIDRMGRPTIGMLDLEIARGQRSEAYKKMMRGVMLSIVIAAAVIVLIANLWFAPMQVNGSAMNPLLQRDGVVLVTLQSKAVKNDVIVFFQNNKLFFRRVIATGGDMVDIGQDGTVSVNGIPLDEPYVAELAMGDCDIDLPYQVSAGTVFVMGDNRTVAKDSRLSEFGVVSKDQIVGKVVFRLWPLSQLGSA